MGKAGGCTRDHDRAEEMKIFTVTTLYLKDDAIAEQLIEWADAISGDVEPEGGGESAMTSLAVVKAGIKSVAEGRHVTVAEILAADD